MGHDVRRPYIRSTNPATNASGVAITSPIFVEFSERMTVSTLNSTNIGVYKDPLVRHDNISFSYNDGLNLLTITPSGNMDVNSRYSAVISGTVTDYNGNSLQMDYWWNFWTTQPSGYIHASGEVGQPSGYTKTGYIEVLDTLPENYTTNKGTSSISPILIYLSDTPEIGNRNYFGEASGSVNPAEFGESFFETPGTSLEYYVDITNQEVLGSPSIPSPTPTWTVAASGMILRVDGTGWVDNNEYIVTLKDGFPGLRTQDLQDDYQFVFTSTYDPLYAGANIIRLNIGPMLQMAMAYIPDDTLNRYIYEASVQADRISPYTIDSNNIPWYIEEFVIYQSKLTALYAAIMIFAGSGAGVKKTLADLSIEIDARGLMPALLPIIEDYRKLVDFYKGMVIAASDSGPMPRWVTKSQNDERRPITDRSWRRLPFNDVRGDSDNYPKWTYTNNISRTQYLTSTRKLVDGRYVTD